MFEELYRNLLVRWSQEEGTYLAPMAQAVLNMESAYQNEIFVHGVATGAMIFAEEQHVIDARFIVDQQRVMAS